MVIDNKAGITMDEPELTEAELFIKRLFVQGDYKHYADKLQIDRDDLKRILYEASAFLGKKNIFCTIAIILKEEEESRKVIISRTGTTSSYIINSQSVRILNDSGNPGDTVSHPGLLEKPQIFSGKLNKEDTILLCSESLTAVIELNFIQRIVISNKSPKEVCKQLLLSASGAGRIDNISVAAFNGAITRRNWDKVRLSKKPLLFIIIPLFLILIGFLIYNLSSGTKEKPMDTSPINIFETSSLPPNIKKDTIVQPNDLNTQVRKQEDIKTKPLDNAKKVKKETIKTPRDIVKSDKDVKFIVNGSVVMISNWESVNQGILYIKWDNGIAADTKRIHKYLDYTSIPSSIKVTYKDKSTKSYRIK
jgi:hypothetical protein